MPFSDPNEAKAYRRAWKRQDRAKKRLASTMTLAQRIAAGKTLAAAAGLKPRPPRKPT